MSDNESTEDRCACCNTPSVRYDGPGWVCKDCRKVLEELDKLPPRDPYHDVQTSVKEQISVDPDTKKHHGTNKTKNFVRVEHLPDLLRRTNKPRKGKENWKWEGLNANGSLPDSWWDGLK